MPRKIAFSDIQYTKIGNKSIRNKQNIAEAFNTSIPFVVNDIINPTTQAYSKNERIIVWPRTVLYTFQHTPYTHHVQVWYINLQQLRKYKIQLNPLKPEDSHEYDEISTQILKITAPGITSLLNYICNKLLSKGIFPDRLKFSLIKPLYKKGSKLDMANYRPISLSTTFSKILK